MRKRRKSTGLRKMVKSSMIMIWIIMKMKKRRKRRKSEGLKTMEVSRIMMMVTV